jgi:NAD(P)-dependent dehydrogenase (short-subunit alcohol dehydrogenase family)
VVEAVLDEFSRLDVAILTVAAPPIRGLEYLESAEWSRCVTAPLVALFRIVRRVVWEFLAAGRGGRLVFVVEPEHPDASGRDSAGIVGCALVSLARSVAKEAGPRAVACNVVRARASGAATETAWGPIVEAALFLASEDASFMNGEEILVSA